MPDLIKLEAYIARPPTRKCREVIAVMEEAVRRHPGEVRLIVFERGAPWPEQPSESLRFAMDKEEGVPLSFAGGKFIVGSRPPTLEEIEARLAEVQRDQARWNTADDQDWQNG